jgi:hypothetical protein
MTTHSFVKTNGCPCSKLTPEDGQRTPETGRVAKIKKLSKLTSSLLLIEIMHYVAAVSMHLNAFYFVTVTVAGL